MNIGFVAPQIGLKIGGIENWGYLFAENFPDYVDFHTFCANDSETICRNKNTISYSKYRKKQILRLHTSLVLLLFRANRRFPFDFTFSSLYSYGLSCYLLKMIKAVPYGVMVHGNELMNEPSRSGICGRLITLIKKIVRSKIFKYADIVFANSNYTKELLLDTYGESNVVVIHPPIKYEDKYVDKDAIGKNYLLLSVGRLIERKGFQYVIVAMKELTKKLPMLEYHIVGRGNYLEKLKRIVSDNNLCNSVVFHGNASENEKNRLYSECDCFIMPSYTIEEDSEVEGFGIVFLEANMYGKYVIATKTGGIQDAIKEGVTGCFVEPRDAGSISSVIMSLYENGFHYSVEDCIEWARSRDISVVIRNYISEISTIIKK